MPTVNVGAILVANSATWQNEQYEFTGTIGVGDLVAPGQLYLGGTAGISNVTGTYVNWFLTWEDMGSVGNAYQYTVITAYNGSTKVATVNWEAATQSPPNGKAWYLFREYPILRFSYWKRNGVAIPGATGLTYTATSADIGADITYEETAGFIPRTTSNLTVVAPSTTGTATSATVTVAGSPTNLIDSAADFTWIGSFKGPALGYDAGRVLSVVPASVSATGSATLLTTDNYVLYTKATEVSIPGLSTGPVSGLIEAPMERPSSASADTLEGQGGASSGLTTGGYYRQYGACHIPGTTKMLVNNTGMYTYQERSLFWRRPINLTTTGQVEGPFIFTDPAAGQFNSRWTGGNIVKIPAAWQSALGGDMLLASGGFSIGASTSWGPALMSINSSSIDGAVAKIHSGNARGGTTTSIQLATSANATPGHYINDYIYVPTISTSAESKIYRITAYDGPTRTATLDTTYPEAPFSRAPITSDTYQIYPNIAGKQLLGYVEANPIESMNSKGEAPIWAQRNIWPSSAFCVPGSDSIVFVCNHVPSIADYGIRTADGWPGQNNAHRLYNPYGYTEDDGPGPKFTGSFFSDSKVYVRFIVYKVSELATVASGSAGFNTIKPRAFFSFPLPYFEPDDHKFFSAAFDDVNNKLFLWQQFSSTKRSIINVYSCSKFA